MKKDWRDKAARDVIRARERAEIARLRLELDHAKERKRRLVREARAMCKRARLKLRDKLRERRRLERERLKAEAAAARRAERGGCKARCSVARIQGEREVQKVKTELVATRAAQRLAARQASRKTPTVPKIARVQESDEAARRDIPPELQGVWDQMKGRFKTGGRRSRAEAFLEWAEENPGEIVAMQSSDADREVARLVREHEAAQKRSRLRKTKAEIAEELKAIPF